MRSRFPDHPSLRHSTSVRQDTALALQRTFLPPDGAVQAEMTDKYVVCHQMYEARAYSSSRRQLSFFLQALWLRRRWPSAQTRAHPTASTASGIASASLWAAASSLQSCPPSCSCSGRTSLCRMRSTGALVFSLDMPQARACPSNHSACMHAFTLGILIGFNASMDTT